MQIVIDPNAVISANAITRMVVLTILSANTNYPQRIIRVKLYFKITWMEERNDIIDPGDKALLRK